MRQRSRQETHDSTQSLLTADDITAQLGIDRSTVYRMAADGRLAAVKVGRQWRFPRSALDGLLSYAAPAPMPASAWSLLDDVAQRLLAITAEQLGVMTVITDMDGVPLIQPVNPCPWLVEHATDHHMMEMCANEWRAHADTVFFVPRFRRGTLTFECAGALIRHGRHLVGQVLAGGVAPPNSTASGLYHLNDAQRAHVISVLPRIAAALSTTTTRVPTTHHITEESQ